MKYDLLVCGVGGQGVLSAAQVIALAAVSEGFLVRQSETRGMSQRGGSVVSFLRLSDTSVHGNLFGRCRASLLLSMEPLESVRFLDYLAPSGVLISNSQPICNIPDYPDPGDLLRFLEALPGSQVIAAGEVAHRVGSTRTLNMVLVGVAAAHLPVSIQHLETALVEFSTPLGQKLLRVNLGAFRAGLELNTRRRNPSAGPVAGSAVPGEPR